jgi:phosphatidylglycerol:prolipoprotein diacylglycerol transferase
MGRPVIPWFELPLVRLGPVTVQPFGLFAAAGVLLAVQVASRAARHRGLDGRAVVDFAIWGVASGIAVGHLVHLVAYHPEELRDPRRVLQFWEGLSSFGGLLGGVLAALVWFRRRGLRLAAYGDALALGIAPGWAVARVGCFLVHDHPGSRTGFPLAVRFPGGPRHDLGLYDALVLLAASGVIGLLWRRRVLEGRLLAVLALLYGAPRFLLDFLRARDVPYADPRILGLTPAQYGAVALLAWAAWRMAAPSRPPPAEGSQAASGPAAEARP